MNWKRSLCSLCSLWPLRSFTLMFLLICQQYGNGSIQNTSVTQTHTHTRTGNNWLSRQTQNGCVSVVPGWIKRLQWIHQEDGRCLQQQSKQSRRGRWDECSGLKWIRCCYEHQELEFGVGTKLGGNYDAELKNRAKIRGFKDFTVCMCGVQHLGSVFICRRGLSPPGRTKWTRCSFCRCHVPTMQSVTMRQWCKGRPMRALQ